MQSEDFQVRAVQQSLIHMRTETASAVRKLTMCQHEQTSFSKNGLQDQAGSGESRAGSRGGVGSL